MAYLSGSLASWWGDLCAPLRQHPRPWETLQSVWGSRVITSARWFGKHHIEKGGSALTGRTPGAWWLWRGGWRSL